MKNVVFWIKTLFFLVFFIAGIIFILNSVSMGEAEAKAFVNPFGEDVYSFDPQEYARIFQFTVIKYLVLGGALIFTSGIGLALTSRNANSNPAPKEKIKTHAEPNGESLNGFVNRAIDESVERDKEKG